MQEVKIIREHPSCQGVVEVESEIFGRMWVYKSQIEEVDDEVQE